MEDCLPQDFENVSMLLLYLFRALAACRQLRTLGSQRNADIDSTHHVHRHHEAKQ